MSGSARSLSRCFILDPEIVVRFIASGAAEPLLDWMSGTIGLRDIPDKEKIRIRLGSPEEWFDSEERSMARGIEAVLSVRNDVKVRLFEGSERAFFELEGIGRASADAPGFQVRTASTILGASFLLLLNRVLLLHAALLIKEENAFLLIGASGAGKTTSAERIPPPWRAISDDLAAAVLIPDKPPRVHGLPTWSRLYPGQVGTVLNERVNINLGYRLKKVFFLEKGKQDERVPLMRSEGVAKIVQSSLQLYSGLWRRFSPEEKIAYKGRLMAGAKRILDRVECSILRVSLNGPYWNLME